MTQSSPIVQIDRRTQNDRREATDQRPNEITNSNNDCRQGERRKTQRRRQIDPTTCERDYSDDEVEFMQALDLYKRTAGRMFPTCSEVLEVVRSLGYVKIEAEDEVTAPVAESTEFEGDLDEEATGGIVE